jgi:SSS family solute:Na+ symporter
MRTGSILYLLALPLNALLGWSIGWIIVVTGLSIILYSMLGGIQAVIWTDAIQGIILIGGAVLCLVLIFVQIPGGFETVLEYGVADQKFSLGSFDLSFTESTFWVMIIYGLFINLQNYGIDQNYVQRYMTTKSLKGAQSSALFGALLYVPVSLLFFLIGTSLYAYFKAFPGLLPPDLMTLDAADKVFPFFIVNHLPAGVTGLLIAAIFAAGMSTVSTSINGTATIVLTDYYKRYFAKGKSEGASMKVLYGSSFIFGVLGVGIGLAMTGVKSALDAWWMLASIFSGGMLGLFLLGFMARKAKRMAAALGTAVGVLVIFWMSISPLWFKEGVWLKIQNPLHANMTIVIGTTVIFLVGFLLTLLLRKRGYRE